VITPRSGSPLPDPFPRMKTNPTPVIDLTYDLFGGADSKYLRAVWRRHRDGAKDRNITFTIEPEDVVRLCMDQVGRCDVTGLEFSFERYADAFVKHPFAPSIDHIQSKGGYAPGNVRLVCAAVNFGMGEWGQELFMRLTRAVVAQENEAKQNR
jgi:hypothetical protein